MKIVKDFGCLTVPPYVPCGATQRVDRAGDTGAGLSRIGPPWQEAARQCGDLAYGTYYGARWITCVQSRSMPMGITVTLLRFHRHLCILALHHSR